MSDLSRQAKRVVDAVTNLVKAAIAEDKRDDPDSMGTYHEEQELEIAMNDFIQMVSHND